MHMLGFKFILGLMFFELVSIQIMVMNTWQKKEKINGTSLNIFALKINLNHNTYTVFTCV